MSGTPRLTALQHLQLIRSFEDRELVALVEDTIQKLQDLGDRLEAFVQGEHEHGEASDGSRQHE